ncbi:DUF4147 domain-containing protein [Halogeometricum sp. CBA1124]|uniref:DUF4147 domain-containing protein n=1 Tax=Halogeometricum sp. CBA1124 TaxID=2668071 RepID=UPI0037447591
MTSISFDADTPTRAHETAIACLRDAVAAVLPDRVVRDAVAVEGDELRVADATYDLGRFDRVLVVGGGKPATAWPTPSKRFSATESTAASWSRPTPAAGSESTACRAHTPSPPRRASRAPRESWNSSRRRTTGRSSSPSSPGGPAR